MNAYQNMSAPPRSTIRVTVKPVGEHVLVKLPSHCDSIRRKLWSMNSDSDRASWLQSFVNEHRPELEAVVRPMGFIVPIIIPIKARVSDSSPFRSLPVVDDSFLSLSLLGRMSGGIYIPRRKITYSSSLFGWYAFPVRHFPQYCGAPGVCALPGNGAYGRARTPAAPKGESAYGRARTPAAPKGEIP